MRLKHRVLSLLLIACLVVGLMPTAAFAAGTATRKAIQLVDGGTAANIGGGQADSIYFGTYKQSSDGKSGYNVDPIKWRVLSAANTYKESKTGTNKTGLFLLSDIVLDQQVWKNDYSGYRDRNYGTSGIRTWLNGTESGDFLYDAFSSGEREGIATTYVETAKVTAGSEVFETTPTADQIFLLSNEDVNNSEYGFVDDDDSRKSGYSDYAEGKGVVYTGGVDWWLRSPGSYIDEEDANLAYVAVVNKEGIHNDTGDNVAEDTVGVRPAFNLNLNSVLFTSATDNSGHNNSFAAPADYSGNEWKVTVKDDKDFSNGASFAGTTALMYGYSDTTLQINHAALSTLSANYTNVTAMLTDNNGNILYYGSISNDTSATSSTITIPAGLAAGEYTLSVYGEDWNGEKLTDYATGTPFTTIITVHKHSWNTSSWEHDVTSHWHPCTADCPVTENSGKDGYAKHSFILEIVKAEARKSAANCTAPATYYKSCECGAVSTSDIDTFSGSALGHSWATDWNSDSTHHWHECENSDCPVTENNDKDGYAEHTSGGTATCQSPATCSGCGQPYGSTDSSNHTGGTEVRGKVDATTTAEGYTGDTYCLGCNTKIATGTTIPKKKGEN